MFYNYEKKFKQAVQTEIEDVFYSNNVRDTSFIRVEPKQTISEMRKKRLKPVGICKDPAHNPNNNYAFIYTDRDGDDVWVHIGKNTYNKWLKFVTNS